MRLVNYQRELGGDQRVRCSPSIHQIQTLTEQTGGGLDQADDQEDQGGDEDGGERVAAPGGLQRLEPARGA